MVNEAVTTLLEGLTRLRADGQPWHAIARLVRDWSKDFNHPARRRSEIWEAAAEKTGISSVMLKRYFAVLLQIDEIAESHKMDAADLLPASFTGAELAARLHSRDSEAGLKALIGLRARTKTIEDVRDELEKAAPLDQNTVKARHGQAVGRCEAVMAKAAPGIFGKGAVSGRRPRVRYFHPVGFEFRDAASGLLAGGDLYLAGTSGSSDPLATIGLSVLISEYLPNFWLMLGPDLDDQVVDRADKTLSILAPRIGILVVGDGGVAVRRPAEGNDEGFRRAAEYRALVETFGTRGMENWKPPA